MELGVVLKVAFPRSEREILQNLNCRCEESRGLSGRRSNLLAYYSASVPPPLFSAIKGEGYGAKLSLFVQQASVGPAKLRDCFAPSGRSQRQYYFLLPVSGWEH